MTKKGLLETIDKSILKKDVSLQALYTKYYSQMTEILKPFGNKTKIDGLESLKIVSNKNTFDMFIRSSSYNAVEDNLKGIVTELRHWTITNANLAEVEKVPTGPEQKLMRLQIIERLDGLIEDLNSVSDRHAEDKAIIEDTLQKLRGAKEILSKIFLPRSIAKSVATVEKLYNEMMLVIDTINKNLTKQCDAENFLSLADSIFRAAKAWNELPR